METYAEIQNNTIVNASVWDDGANPPGLTRIDNLNPQPGIGWTLANGTWTAPEPPPPTPQQTAQDNLQQLAATAQSQLTQAQADAAMFAATPVGSTLTADHIAALGRFADGFASLINVISNHCVYTGAIPPSEG